MHNVIYLDMPTKIKETVTQNEDGSYTIFLNSKLNKEQNEQGYLHALHHINEKDFERVCVNDIEVTAHERSLNG